MKTKEHCLTLLQPITFKLPQKNCGSQTQAKAQIDKDSAVIPVYGYVNPRLAKPHIGGYSSEDVPNELPSKHLFIIKNKTLPIILRPSENFSDGLIAVTGRDTFILVLEPLQSPKGRLKAV